MGVSVTGVDAPTFKAAVAKIKAHPGFAKAEIQEDSGERFSYTLPGVGGDMKNEPLRII